MPVFLPGKPPWTEKLGGLESMGSQSRTGLSDYAPGDSGGQKSLAGYSLLGHRGGRELVTEQQSAS